MVGVDQSPQLKFPMVFVESNAKQTLKSYHHEALIHRTRGSLSGNAINNARLPALHHVESWESSYQYHRRTCFSLVGYRIRNFSHGL